MATVLIIAQKETSHLIFGQEFLGADNFVGFSVNRPSLPCLQFTSHDPTMIVKGVKKVYSIGKG